MKRTLPRLIGVLALVALVTGDRIEAAPKPVNTATSPLPIVIAILSDHYTSETEFDLDVQNLITNGLLANPYYAAHKAELDIVSFYDPLQAGSQSNYGFDVETPSGYCAMSWIASDDASNTATRIGNVVGGSNPIHTIVIGDHPYNIGCTDSGWTYVGKDVIGTDVLAHELGHGLANLYDEWFFESNRGVSHPGIPINKIRNCYDTRLGPTLPWIPPLRPPFAVPMTFAGAGGIAGCDFFELNVVHGYPPQHNGQNYCLMGATHGAKFCPICQALMQRAFDDTRNPDVDNPDLRNPDVENPDIQNPRSTRPPPPTNLRIVKVAFQQPAPGTVKPTTPAPAPPPAVPPTTSPIAQPPTTSAIVQPVAPRPIIRLIAAFDPVSGRLRPKKGIPITARYTPSHRRLGDYVYEIVANGQTRDVGVIPSNLFQSRTYQGGTAHQSSAPHEADITIQIPDVTDEMLRTGKVSISIRIYRLSDSVMDPRITPAVLTRLRQSGLAEQRGAEVTVKDIISVM